MIVICTGCQARFRVADEKIGPRGAKVRCSRCQNVFVVKREAAAAPAPLVDLDLTPGLPRPAPARDPFAPAGAAASVIGFPGSAAGSGGAAPDPFAAAGLDAFDGPGPGSGSGPAPAAADPFASLGGGERPPSVKFPAGDLGRGDFATRPASDDPFAPPADPFGGVPPTPTASQSLPVTDLAQLLGSVPAPAAAPPPAPPRPAAPPAPPPVAAEPSPPFPSFGDDLTLEERKSGEHGLSFADPADVLSADAGPTSFGAAFPGGGAFPSGAGAYEGGPLAPPAPGEESLALATDPTPAPAGLDRPAPSSPPPAQLPEEAPPPRPPPRARPDPAAELAESAGAHPGLAPRGRLRSAAVNALALVALVVVALTLREVWRGGRLGPGALRPSRLLEAIRGERRSAEPFELSEVRTAVYPQGSGAVLFVRGVVVCRAPAPRHVQVQAELVRDGQVLAKGEVLAGALPTPEEVWRATDRAALDALSSELAKRAPKQVAPGDRLEFLITLGDAPTDLAGTSVRVRAGAQVADAR